MLRTTSRNVSCSTSSASSGARNTRSARLYTGVSNARYSTSSAAKSPDFARERECRERRARWSSPEEHRCVDYERRRAKASSKDVARRRRATSLCYDVAGRRCVTSSNQLPSYKLRLSSGMPDLDKSTLHTWLHHWQDEADAAYLYLVLAGQESDPTRQDVYIKLAGVEERHVQNW